MGLSKNGVPPYHPMLLFIYNETNHFGGFPYCEKRTNDRIPSASVIQMTGIDERSVSVIMNCALWWLLTLIDGFMTDEYLLIMLE